MSENKQAERWLILVACCIAIFCFALNNVAYSPLLAIIRNELALSYTESGLIATAFFVGYAAGQIPWGHFADKFGGRKIIIFGLIGSTMASALFGTSTTMIEVFLWRCIAGFLSAAIFVPTMKIVSERFSRDERSLAIGIFIASSGLALLAAPPLSITIEAELSWRGSIYSFALLGLLMSPLVWFLLRRAPQSAHSSVEVSSSRAMFRKPVFWALGYTHFVRMGLIFTLTSWVPFFLMEDLNFSIFTG